MNNYNSALLIPLLACAFASAASEAVTHVGEQIYAIKPWTIDDGLPQSHVKCLKQTRDGYLWVGTLSGLARFDGVRFKKFDKSTTPELVSDTISALAEDNDGTLWIGTGDCLVSYRDHQFQRITTTSGLPDWKVWRLVPCSSGGLWVNAGVWVSKLNNRRFSAGWEVDQHGESKGLPNIQVVSMQESTDGWLDIFTTRSWLRLSPLAGELRTNYIVNSTNLPFLGGHAAHESGVAWLGTPDGLHRLHSGVLEPPQKEGLEHGPVGFVYADKNSNLWVHAQASGLYRQENGRWARVALGDDTAGETAECIEEDSEGNFWIGSGRGLTQLKRQSAQTFGKQFGLRSDDVLSVCEGADGAIWLATGRGIDCFQGTNVMKFGNDELARDLRDSSVWPNSKGGVWFPKAFHGVYECQGGFFTHRIDQKILPGHANTLYTDRANRLWVGARAGAVAFEVGRFDTPCATITNPALDVRCIFEDHAGTFWFGTAKQGLVQGNGGAVTATYTKKHGLSDDSVWSVLEDADGTLWIGTDHGFCRYKQGKFFSFSPQHGLPEPTVNCVLLDDLDCVWLSGLQGIHRAKRADLNAVADGHAASAQFITLGTADGMANPETNGGENQPAGWKARDGQLWFPTIKGLVVIDPKTVPLNESGPPVIVEQVKADGEVVYGEGRGAKKAESGKQKSEMDRRHPKSTATREGVRIAAGHGGVMEFRYTANSFVAPERLGFRYRILGVDADWREETKERVASYHGLPQGRSYTFEVEAANHHHVWGLQPTSFAFSIAPLFWQTWPFYVLCGCAVFGFAAWFHIYRLRWQRRLLKLDVQHALASERTRIARDLHDDLGADLTGLALRLDVVQSQCSPKVPLHDAVADVARDARGLVDNMREAVWATNPDYDDVESLADFLGQYTENYLSSAGLRCRLELPAQASAHPLNSHARHQLFLAVKEALHNVVRHAQASEVQFRIEQEQKELRLVVADNGRGIRPVKARSSERGLYNMEKRVTSLGGKFSITSIANQGTRIEITIPLGSDDSGTSVKT